MSSFLLTFNFNLLGSVSVGQGQSWLAHTSNIDVANNFFDWLEGKKYNADASIKYVSDDVTSSDLFIIRKYFKTLRFRLPDRESAYYYYQQRYHATENDNVQTLSDYLGTITGSDFKYLFEQLGLDVLLSEKINMLSTGEFRKAIALKISMSKPDVMFIEEPYTGLDARSCKSLNQLFAYLVLKGTSIVIFTSTDQKPDSISNNLKIGNEESYGYLNNLKHIVIPDVNYEIDFNNAFELKKIVAGYNGREVLHNVDWTVNRNQKWSLTGHNGAGKSTLLSFVYADNPQVYCNNVNLFDKQRGTGESIWDVKDQIGFYSSELHLYFNKLQTVEASINSIIFQNPYKKRILGSSDVNFRSQLLNYYNLNNLDQKLLSELSVVNQKIILLIAVLLKNTPLLILDEPFQGFDNQLINKSLDLINKYVVNRTFVMVSHNNKDFPACIDKHFYLENGTGRAVADLANINSEMY